MITYALEDSLGNIFNLNDASIIQPARGSVTLSEDVLTFDNKIVEKSSLPGAVQLGKRRLMSKDVTVTFNRAEVSDVNFNLSENTLIRFLNSAIYLIDVTNNRRTRISITEYNIAYDNGSFKRSSDNTISMRLLEPFWTTITPNVIVESLLVDVNQIAISSLGYIESPGRFIFTASAPVSDIHMYVDETKKGVEILDNIFGTSIYNTMELNCERGTLTIENYDRINSIFVGTGFFNFPTYACTLIVIPNAICDLQILRYKREYI